MRLIQLLPPPPVLQIMPRAALNLAHPHRLQIRRQGQLLRLRVLPALCGKLRTPLRRHRLVQRWRQRAGADEGFQRPRHFASLGRFGRLQACGGADELCADRGLSAWSYAAS